MATTQNNYTGDGSTVLYSFTFPYISIQDIKVSVDGVIKTITTEYTLANATQISFVTAPATGAVIRIFRETAADDLAAVFYPGSAIRAKDLNDNFTQNLYVTQESERDVDESKTISDNAVTIANGAVTTANSTVTTANSAVTTANASTATANTANTNANAAVTTANAASTTATTAATDAASAVTTANTASTNASNAVTTANSAATDAATAITTANGAVTTANAATTAANNAQTDATSATSTANTASTNATNAVSTANSAATTANSASTAATNAVNTANAASAAVSNAVLFTLVANVAAIPGSPSNNDYVEIGNSTGIQSFTPLSGLPSGFVGASGLTVRIRYDSSATSWVFMSYFANDSETRYLTKNVPVVTGDATNGSGQITLNCENNSHGVKIKGPPHSAAATYTLTLPNNTGTANQVLTTNGSGLLTWSNGGSPTIDAGNFTTGGSLVTTSQTFDGGSFD
ncbi:phage tail fiber protein [Methylophaga sp. UBA4502]|uniref:phage tail fiber domain-containing protein n=1 Tax=Methylophaga sp. UBA4502 TaxID=1946893 RepID=UPI0025D61CEC|nr:phage tail fiber protein [Methylophaga sp. UBA4502]